MSSPWVALRAGDSPLAVSRRVRRAHEHFLSAWPSSGLPGSTSPDVRPVVAQSWVRSRAGGVDPERPGGTSRVMDAEELDAHRRAHPLAAVLPVVQRLLVDGVADDGDSGLVVAITDATGRMMWVVGDPDLRERAQGMRFVEGADWSERSAGTNAPGTALELDHSVQIFGTEHFGLPVQPWSCAAAPVHDPDTGDLLGAVDLTGGDQVAAPHVLTLVRATAAAMEAELRLHRMRGRKRSRPPTALLTVLGRSRPTLRRGPASTPLSLRHAEILLLLAQHPDGLTADELGVLLDDRELDTVTVRAEVSRLRRAVGPTLLESRPYRLLVPLRTDVDEVRALLAAGDRAGALRRLPGAVLPRSHAPAVVALRAELAAEVRGSLLREPDPELLLAWTATEQGHGDAELWEACLRSLPPRSPSADLVRARLSLLRRP
ncbi:GAF domain-containing protein [Rhodococcus aerolatus]